MLVFRLRLLGITNGRLRHSNIFVFRIDYHGSEILSECMRRFFWAKALELEGPAIGRFLVWGWLHYEVDNASACKQTLDRVFRALKGWKNLCPDGVKDPIPIEIAWDIIVWLCENDRKDAGQCFALQLDIYGRPAETLALIGLCFRGAAHFDVGPGLRSH